MKRKPFEPHPEDSDVLDSLLDAPVEPGTKDEDGDDQIVVEPPGPVMRVLLKLGVR